MTNNVEIDFLTTPVITKSGSHETELVWPEARYLIGWGPWLGVDKGNVFEGHLALNHVPRDTSKTMPVFMRGPHKEAEDVMYDVAGGCDFFPSGTDRLIAVGEKVVLELYSTDTGSKAGTFGIQASARVFSVKAQEPA